MAERRLFHVFGHEPLEGQGAGSERLQLELSFIGRQGSATGRTLLMSPAMVAAAAIKGRVTDVRELL